ncbi:hypothetical protein FRB97_007765 [Tulasnella sp. 331]|nr:hypothetical protein FRB97_007765 [Tulasnella sp. 331]
MQTATAYSTFLHDTPASSTEAAGNFNDNDDQADSGSALEDSPRDESREDDDDYEQHMGDHENDEDEDEDEDDNSGDASRGHKDGQVEGTHQQTSSGSGSGSYPQAYTLAYTPGAQEYINPYFYTPPQHNPYSITGGQGEYYPTAMAHNPVPVPTIALSTPHPEGAVAADLASGAGPSGPSDIHYQSVSALASQSILIDYEFDRIHQFNAPSPPIPPTKRPRRSNAVALDPDADNRPIEELYTELPSTVVRPVQPRVTQAKFQCTMCDARFPRKNAVVAHIKTHLGKKKYSCSHSGWQVFAFSTNLTSSDSSSVIWPSSENMTASGTRLPTLVRGVTSVIGKILQPNFESDFDLRLGFDSGRPFARPDALRRHKEKGTCKDLAPPPPPPAAPPEPDAHAQQPIDPNLVFTAEERAHFLSLSGQLGQMQSTEGPSGSGADSTLGASNPNVDAPPPKPLKWQTVRTGPSKPGKRVKKSKPIITDEAEASLPSEMDVHHHTAMGAVNVNGGIVYDPTAFAPPDGMMDGHGHHPAQFMQFPHGIPPPLPPPPGTGPPPLSHMADFSHPPGNGGSSLHHFLPGQLSYPYTPHDVYNLHHHNGDATPSFQPSHSQNDGTTNFPDHHAHTGQPSSFLPSHNFNSSTQQSTLDGTPLLQHLSNSTSPSRQQSPDVGIGAHLDATGGGGSGLTPHHSNNGGMSLVELAVDAAQRKRKRRQADEVGGDLDGQQLHAHAMHESSPHPHPHNMATLNMGLVYPTAAELADETLQIVRQHEAEDASPSLVAESETNRAVPSGATGGGKRAQGGKGGRKASGNKRKAK